MLKRLRMVGWKSFEDAELALGPFTLLVGANASGKSNVREALRFLHAVGRGYNLAEIFGGKYSAGERQWSGIRGGVREAAFRGGLKLAFDAEIESGEYHIAYHIGVDSALLNFPAKINAEWVRRIMGDGTVRVVYDAAPRNAQDEDDHGLMEVSSAYDILTAKRYSDDEAVVGTFFAGGHVSAAGGVEAFLAASTLRDMRFIDPSPEAMRQPSMPGQTILSDRGENLSSVLQSLCSRDDTKSEIIQWLRALTPMDVSDLKFDVDRRGQVLLILVENDGTEISADSASEGTLRFLGLLAALMSPESGLYFFEEIENGLHPSRIRLLLDLIHQRTQNGRIQVVATTHSPSLMALLPDDLLEYTSLVVRPEEACSSRIVRLLDVPDAARVLRDHDRGELFASGWFEDMVEFGESRKREAQDRGAAE